MTDFLKLSIKELERQKLMRELLYFTKLVDFSFLGQVGCARIFLRSEISAVYEATIQDNLRLPFTNASVPRYAENARRTVRPGSSKVLHVLGARCFSEISEFIITWPAVFVVYFLPWKFSSHVKPSKTMSAISFPENFNHPVFVHKPTGAFPDSCARSGGLNPCKCSAVSIVMQDGTKKFLRERWHLSLRWLKEWASSAAMIGQSCLTLPPETGQPSIT